LWETLKEKENQYNIVADLAEAKLLQSSSPGENQLV
jgi:hypothetical protein